MSDETQPGVLTWLHLSDLHVQSESWQQDHVLDALVRDLPQLLQERELRPDLLFVTGDVAARGQRAEYDGAVHLLDALAKRLGLDRRQQVFVVPGNHDVERGKIGRLAKRDHASLLELNGNELRDAVGELLGDAKEFRLYGERLEEWCAFTETLLGRARSVSVERPWRSDVVDVGGLPVGVLSLCTAWASGPDDRKGSLILGERQLHDMVAEARDGGAQLVIALMHHPLHWLHDGEHSAIRGRLERDVDVVLHGHVHDAHSALHIAARSAHAEIGAGAAYAGLGEDPHHGFSVGRLDLAEGRLDVHGFTWSTRSGKWHADAGAPGADAQGKVSLPFSPAAMAPASAKGGTEVLATRLRHAAAAVYATVDFAGLGAGGPRRHVTLEQIFVPLHLIAKDLDDPDPSWFEGEVEEEPVFERGEPDEDIPDDDEADVFRDRAYSPEGAIVGAYLRVSGRVPIASLAAMLAAGRKMVVLGGPGSGKSTLAKYLASTIAAREGGPVPILLTVRDWIAEGKREHLLDMAARQAATSLSVRTDRDALERLCDGGQVVLIVDGVDEAADAAVRRVLRDQVHGFVTRFRQVPVLVTSRIAGYHEIPLDDAAFDELMLEPFDDEAIEQFVRRWYDLVEDDPTARLRKRVDLLHALDVEPRAKELARNPLLATLIGMVHFSHAELPGDRAKLYGKIIELLLVTWPAERKRELPELHGTVQQPMLETLALRLQEQRAGRMDQAAVLIDVEQLESMLEDLLSEHLRDRSAPERRYLARKWGKWLVEGSGLLQEQQPGRVGFLHLSLMEYMAGRALFERTVGSGYEAVAVLVAERHDQAVWRETLLLMLGSENKKRELGQAVVERLLAVELEASARWSVCIFGLALLREEVDMGALRERLLERTCETAVEINPGVWWLASSVLADAVRFGRLHGEIINAWLRDRLERGACEFLAGVVALATEAISKEELLALLSARVDRSATVLSLLGFEREHFVGQWARRSVTPLDALAWARSAQLESIVWRSLEEAMTNTGSAWILALLVRSSWMTSVTTDATSAALVLDPRGDLHAALKMISWLIDDERIATAHLDLSVSGAGPYIERVDFARHFSEGFAFSTATRWVMEFIRSLSPAQSPSMSFARRLAQYFWMHLASGFVHNLVLEFDMTLTTHLSPTFTQALVQRLATYLSFPPPRTKVWIGTEMPALASSSSLWEHLRMAPTEDASPLCAKLFTTMAAEMHAALVTADIIGDFSRITPLAILRTENRWLNLFFTPLVEHVTKSRPLSEHPDLHALLLTYGLIQYQTTWEWPDCPHWRAWFTSDPPAHWLPAHVWHLVRSIQGPADPTHRQQADAALDRNDWPELAQALRETTLVPTPPEVLALFDHGDEHPSS